MVHSDLLKLSMTLVLLVATAFVSVAAVAADDSGTIRLVKAAPALGGTADDWYGQDRSPAKASGAAVVSDWFERHPDAITPGDSAADRLAPLDWYFAHDHAVLDGDNNVLLGQSAGLATLDSPNNQWIGPETVSAALSLLDDSNGRWIGPETVSAFLGQLQP